MRKRYFIIISIVVLLITLRLLLPTIVLKYVNKTLDELEGYEGHVEDIDIALWRGAYQIEGVKLVQTSSDVPIPFLEIQNIDLSVQWKALFKGSIVGEVILTKPILNFVAASAKSEAQTGEEVDWTEAVKELIPLQINRFEIINGKITYKDYGSDPVVDVYLEDFDLLALNLSNASDVKEVLPSTLHVTGTSLGGGQLTVDMRLNALKKIPDFDLNIKFDKADMTKLNNFIKAYGGFDVEKGYFSLYSETALYNNKLSGYVKPIIDDIKVLDLSEEENRDNDGFFQKIKEALIGGAAEVLENQKKDQVATKIPIEGDLSAPDVAIWPTITNVFKNAFIQAFRKEVDNTVNIGNVTN